jgi:hypothetical protein
MKEILILLFCLQFVNSNAQQVFTDLDSFLKYANSKSTSLQSGQIKMDQAKKAKIAAIASIPDPTGSASFSYTDNLTLPVTLFPANFSDPNAPANEFRQSYGQFNRESDAYNCDMFCDNGICKYCHQKDFHKMSCPTLKIQVNL